MRKKLIALLLVMAMVLSMVPATAFADEASEQVAETESYASVDETAVPGDETGGVDAETVVPEEEVSAPQEETVGTDVVMNETKSEQETEDTKTEESETESVEVDIALPSQPVGQGKSWDCVYFGSYPQAEVMPTWKNMVSAVGQTYLDKKDYIIDEELYAKLQSATWDDNNDTTIDHERYHRINRGQANYYNTSSANHYKWADSTSYHYFKYQAIKWRILSVDQRGEALLVADKCLDSRPYNSEKTAVTWASSDMRQWLNGYFYNTAFSQYERESIRQEAIETPNNTQDNTDGGMYSMDKVFLLSEAEIYDTGCGFYGDWTKPDLAKCCKTTTYAKAMGGFMQTESGWGQSNIWWWTRTAAGEGIRAVTVSSTGEVYRSVTSVNHTDYGVRPAIKLRMPCDLSTFGGTVTSQYVTDEYDAVIMIPGICGSELMDAQGETRWVDPLLLVRADKAEAALGLNANGVSNNSLYPVNYDLYGENEGIGAQDTYTSLVNDLYKHYHNMCPVHFFAYDWRLSIKDAAGELDAFMNRKGYRNVVIVAHSMGGLVASQYIVDGHAGNVNKLITLATPYYGAPKALYVLETGHFLDGATDLLTHKTFKQLAKNLTTIYELLPSNKYADNLVVTASHAVINKKKMDYVREDYDQVVNKRHNATLYQRAKTTLEHLYAASAAVDLVDSYVLYGDASKTITTVDYERDSAGNLSNPDDYRIKYGDGTVPMMSATLYGRTTTGKYKNAMKRFEKIDHTHMAQDYKVISSVLDAIENRWSESVSAMAATTTERSIEALTKIEVEGASAYTITDQAGQVLARISDTEFWTAEGHEYDFYFVGDNYHDLVGFLDPGAYEVQATKLSGENFTVEVTEYEHYTNNRIREIKVYEYTAPGTAQIVVSTDSNTFSIDCNGDGTYELQQEANVSEITEQEDPIDKPSSGGNTPGVAKPQTLKNLKAEPAGKQRVKLSWTVVPGAEGYLVYGFHGSPNSGVKYGYVGMKSGGSVNSFVDIHANDTDYNYYWVFPYVKDSSGKMITGGCEKYAFAKGVTLAVTNLKAAGQTGGVKLTWSPVSGADGYLVYGFHGSPKSGAKYGYIGMTKGNSVVTFLDRKALKTDYNYYYVFPFHYGTDGKMIVGGTAKYVWGKAR